MHNNEAERADASARTGFLLSPRMCPGLLKDTLHANKGYPFPPRGQFFSGDSEILPALSVEHRRVIISEMVNSRGERG